MPMYHLIKHSSNYSKTSGIFWQYYEGTPGEADNGPIKDSESFKPKKKIMGNIPADDNTKDVEITVPLKYLSNFWETHQIPFIDCEINLILTWYADCIIFAANGATKSAITNTKIYDSVVTLSTHDNAKILQQLKSTFKKTVNWNKYQSKVTIERQNLYLNYLVDPSFQGAKIFFVLLFESNADRTGHAKYFPPKVEIKDCNVMIDGQNFVDQPRKNNYDDIQKFWLVKEMIIQLIL